MRADEVFNSASVIKIPVAVQALEMADTKRLDLGKRLTLTAADVRGGSGIFRYHDAGLQPTVRDVLLQMIVTSDNTATDLAIAQVGGVASVNAWIANAGYGGGMKLTQTTGELFAKYNALRTDRRPQRPHQRRQGLLAGRAVAAGHRHDDRGDRAPRAALQGGRPRSCCG